MIKVFVQAEAGSCENSEYNEKTLEFKRVRRVPHPYPYPYGFILNTTAEDGDCLDCYIITDEPFKTSDIVECEPIGLLEQHEGDEIDHKILARLPGDDVEASPELLQQLQSFIQAIFAAHPEIHVTVGPLLSRDVALDHIEKHRENLMPTYEPNWPSLHQYRVPDWFRDAKFGIFIHWGIYSVPALMNEWYPRSMYLKDSAVYEHHRETYGANFGYKDFIPQFKAEKFDPAEWARLFREAGARYIVPVAEHHDGFPMYSTPLTRWNAGAMGPQRDIIGELTEAFRRDGLVAGLSSHRAEHWWFMNGGRDFPSDVQDAEFADFYGPATPSPELGSPEFNHNDWTPRPDAAYLDDWLARCCELVDRFAPKLVYFDWWIHQLAFKPYLLKFAAYYYNYVPDGVINYKLDAFEPGTAVFDIERGFAAEISPEPFQTCTSVSRNSWGYISHHVYKEPTEIIHHLIDVVSKNGCLLLNVGPKPDGTIPDEEQEILREIGRWLAVNGEALYGSRPWKIYGEGPTELMQGQFTDNEVKFTGRDIRFTVKNDRVYAIALGADEDSVEIKSLATGASLSGERVRAVKLLGFDGSLSWSQNDAGLSIQIPQNQTAKHALVFEIVFDDRP